MMMVASKGMLGTGLLYIMILVHTSLYKSMQNAKKTFNIHLPSSTKTIHKPLALPQASHPALRPIPSHSLTDPIAISNYSPPSPSSSPPSGKGPTSQLTLPNPHAPTL
jgi:hypothetical protein